MKRNLLCLAALAASFAAPMFGAAGREARKMPELSQDSSPVGEGAKAPVVTSFADVLEPVQQSVVTVDATKLMTVSNRQLNQLNARGIPVPKEEGVGSGIIISPDGYILTNNHVVEDADDLKVTLPDQRDFKATVVGKDPKTDIAVIKIDATGLQPITIADSDKTRIGDLVFAVGNPLGVGQTVTMGIISAKSRMIGIIENGYEDFIQTDAAINMGNSGGALVDAKGRLIGINGAILSPTQGSIGIGFAVPINLATNIMRMLIETGTVIRGHLGIDVRPITEDLAAILNVKTDVRGVVIDNVYPGTPAEQAGLKAADILLTIDSRPITSENDLKLVVSQRAPGSGGDAKIIREGKEQVVHVTFDQQADRPPDEIFAGITVAPLDDVLRNHYSIADRISEGLVVTNVVAGSESASKFEAGQVILKINQVPVKSVSDAVSALKNNVPAPRGDGTVAGVLISTSTGTSHLTTVLIPDSSALP